MIFILVVLALTVSNLKGAAFWDVKCRSVEIHRRSGGTQCFYLHGQRVRQERYQQEEGNPAFHRIFPGFLLVLLFDPESGDITILRNFSEFLPIGYLKSDL
jgi:hypothetical protein